MQQLGAYALLEVAGRGGMATVYRAHQPSMDRLVAIKVIEKHIADQSTGIDLFHREARLIARLEHAHILPVYDFDGGHTPPYIVMRYIDGGTLRDRLNAGRLPMPEGIRLFQMIASAVDYAHRQGIIHRDIKPSNILIDREGSPFVSDFGIARALTDTPDEADSSGALIGTPDYMAPEQIRSDRQIDQRADIYALGVLLFHMLTGRLPYAETNTAAILMAHLNSPIPDPLALNPALPPAFREIIQRALAKQPADRYASVGALLEAAQRLTITTSRIAPVSPPAKAEQDTPTVIARAPEFTPMLYGDDLPRPRSIQGLYGAKARFTGRRSEMEILQNAFHDVTSDSELRMVTVIGEPGIGKSRLLEEFDFWAQQQDHDVLVLRARGRTSTQEQPYALLHTLIAARFGITEQHTSAEARERLESGLRALIGTDAPDMAHVIGHSIGYDLSGTPAVAALLGSPAQLAERGRTLHRQVMRLTAERTPILMYIEDAHTADLPSLLWLNEIANAHPDLRLLIVMAARPALLERLPQWGTGQPFHTVLRLLPLNRRDARALINDLLARAPDVPPSLRDGLVDHAEGNPYFIEEMIRMMIEDRVIIIENEQWRIEPTRVTYMRVPPTLLAVLHERLDTLLQPERVTLQRAAIIGRVFQEGALRALDAADSIQIHDLPRVLTALSARGFISPRQSSGMGGEYTFTQNLLREATNATLTETQRRIYHDAAAAWLVGATPERQDEVLLTIAGHYEQGSTPSAAVPYLRRAGERAIAEGSYHQARHILERALALLPPADAVTRMPIQIRLGETLRWLNLDEDAIALLEQAADTARATGDHEALADAITFLSVIARSRGERTVLGYFDEVMPYIDSLSPATQIKLLVSKALTHNDLGDIDTARDLAERGLAMQPEDPSSLLRLYNILGTVYVTQDIARSKSFYQRGIALTRQIGNRAQETLLMINMGYVCFLEGDYQSSLEYTQAALAAQREMGYQQGFSILLYNLVEIFLRLNRLEEAESYLIEAITLTREKQLSREMPIAVSILGQIALARGQAARGLALKGAALEMPMLSHENRLQIQEEINAARQELRLSQEEVTAMLAQGSTLDIEHEIDLFLNGRRIT